MSEHFDWFAGWPLLCAVPLFWLLHLWLDRRRARQVREVFGPRAERLLRTHSPGRVRWRRRARTLALLLALLAALGPRFGVDLRSAQQRGVDIVLALDVSRSMLAEDQAPSRLAAAKAQIAALTEQARGDRLALVLFAGTARLRVPLTQDLGSLRTLAGLADPYDVVRGGSDLGAALDTARSALPDAAAGHAAIVLLTDGEDHGGAGLRAAQRCAERGIVVHAIGFGSVRGAKIPLTDEEGYLRAASGDEVVTALDPRGLERIAAQTGGQCLVATERPEALLQLYERRLLAMARQSFEDELRQSRLPRYQWSLLLALLLWILDLCFADRRFRPRSA